MLLLLLILLRVAAAVASVSAPLPTSLFAFGRCAFVKLLLSAGVAVVGLTLQYERFGCCCFATVSGSHNDAHFLPKDLRRAVQAAY